MSKDEPRRLSEEMASRLWKRAAELQSEAAQRADDSSVGEAEKATFATDSDGYALEHVRQAAVEAGIAGEFVDAALAEVTAQVAVGHSSESTLDRVANGLLGPGPDFLEARCLIAAPPEDVYQTMHSVFPAAPYSLALRDIQGDVLAGGAMIFDVPRVIGFSYTQFAYDMSHPGIKQIMVSILPVEPGSCEVVVRAPLRAGRRVAGGIFGTLTGAAGVGGVAAGGGLGTAIGTGFGLSLLGLVPAAGVGALLVGGALGATVRSLTRRLYRYSLGRGRNAVEGLLGVLRVTVLSDWGGSGGAADTPLVLPPTPPQLGA